MYLVRILQRTEYCEIDHFDEEKKRGQGNDLNRPDETRRDTTPTKNSEKSSASIMRSI